MEEDTRSKILLAAGEAFAEFGFERATMRQISRLAGVNLALINYHFGDKERLYIETLKYAHRFREEQTPLPEWAEGTPPEEKLQDFINVMITRLLVAQELPWQTQLMMREMVQPTGACREMAEDYIRPQFELILSILSELVPQKMPRPQLQKIAFSIIAQVVFYKICKPIQMMMVTEAVQKKNFKPKMIADHIFQFSLSALGIHPLVSADSGKNQKTKKKVQNQSPARLSFETSSLN